MAARVRPWGAAPTTQRPSSAALAELLGEDGPPASTVALASRLQSYEDELVKVRAWWVPRPRWLGVARRLPLLPTTVCPAAP